MPARCPTSKPYSNSRNRQRARRLVAFARLGIYFNESWSVRIVKRMPFKYGRDINTNLTTARRSCRVVSCFCSAFGNDRDQYPTGLVVLLGGSRNNTHPFGLLRASVYNVYFLLASGSASIGGETSFSGVLKLYASPLLKSHQNDLAGLSSTCC